MTVEMLFDQVQDLASEQTIRGVIITLLSGLLILVTKAGWKWMRSPTTIGPVAKAIVNHLLDEEREEDSDINGRDKEISTPIMEVAPRSKHLFVDDMDVWDAMTKAELKGIKKAHGICYNRLLALKEEKGLNYREERKQEALRTAASVLKVKKEGEQSLPFVKKS